MPIDKGIDTLGQVLGSDRDVRIENGQDVSRCRFETGADGFPLGDTGAFDTFDVHVLILRDTSAHLVAAAVCGMIIDEKKLYFVTDFHHAFHDRLYVALLVFERHDD